MLSCAYDVTSVAILSVVEALSWALLIATVGYHRRAGCNPALKAQFYKCHWVIHGTDPHVTFLAEDLQCFSPAMQPQDLVPRIDIHCPRAVSWCCNRGHFRSVLGLGGARYGFHVVFADGTG